MGTASRFGPLLAALVAAGCASAAAGPPLLRSPGAAPALQDWDGGGDSPGAGEERKGRASVGAFLWMPTFNGSLTIDGFRGRDDGDPIALGVGLSAETRSDAWVGMGDFFAMALSDDLAAPAQPGPDFSEMRQRLGLFEVAAGPRLLSDGREFAVEGGAAFGPDDLPRAVRARGLEADVLIGLRFVQYRLRFRDPATGERDDIADRLWLDPTVGARVEWTPLRELSLGVQGDVGIPVMSGPTWQVIAGLSIGSPGGTHLTLGFRALKIDYEDRSGHFHVEAILAGPWLGVEIGF
jgi:hypothetical protein